MTPDDPRHGSVNGYSNLACRCQPCKNAWAAAVRKRKAERTLRGPSDDIHGKTTTYTNWGCRCRPCTDAHATYYRNLRRGRRLGKPDAALAAPVGEAVTGE